MRRIDLGERPTSREDLAGWYGSLLEQQAESGLSVTDYAARVGISPWTLYQWRRRLASSCDDDRAARPKLIEVAVAQPELLAAGGLVVRLDDGRRSITVPSGFDADELRRLVEVLESC